MFSVYPKAKNDACTEVDSTRGKKRGSIEVQGLKLLKIAGQVLEMKIADAQKAS